ncbi:orotidine-5'-phosphate decarboxylase [Coralliovum pocilloporae]|uniref:orotidine-5'-phosphate decarboxylase n=1 Tax=Coralliovum pocilloporae TaxID=3066369 RepID=UPI003306C53F
MYRPKTARDRLILPLDVPTVDEARAVIDTLGDSVTFYKIGMQLQFAGGLAFAEELAKSGKQVFLDVKLLDIDNTIAKAVENVCRMGMTFMTLHAYPKAMRAAVVARGNNGLGLLGVTVLTSMDQPDLAEAGYATDVADLVAKRAVQAREAGMSGIVCSPLEASAMRKLVGDDMVLVTPGIRPRGADVGDQKRIMTPTDAIRAGSDYLVVGRPVLAADNPRLAADRIVEEIEQALA